MDCTNTVDAFDARKNVLISYHYFKKLDLSAEIERLFPKPYPRFFMDSGAWSAFTLWEKIDLDAYMAFLHKHRSVLWTYSNLDNMTSSAVTAQNQIEMEAAGLRPLAVFHTGEEWSRLEEYVERYSYMALGKIIPFRGTPKVIIPWMAKCMRIAAGTGTRFHGFGLSSVNLLRLFSWYSSDSSSWMSSFRYGYVPLWDDSRGKLRQVDYPTARRHYTEERHLWDAHGHDLWRPLDDGKITRDKVAVMGAMAYMKMADALQREHRAPYAYFFATTPTDWEAVRDAFAIRYPEKEAA